MVDQARQVILEGAGESRPNCRNWVGPLGITAQAGYMDYIQNQAGDTSL